jgi:hypothetical protein
VAEARKASAPAGRGPRPGVPTHRPARGAAGSRSLAGTTGFRARPRARRRAPTSFRDGTPGGVRWSGARSSHQVVPALDSPAPTPPPPPAGGPPHAIDVELIAVVAAVTEDEPRVLTIREGRLLPSGPFDIGDRSLQASLRAWVERQTHHPLGYVEQLYTFADRDRSDEDTARRVISISYLGLTRQSAAADQGAGAAAAAAAARDGAGWRRWYWYFPWEDWRAGPPGIVAKCLAPRLRAWAAASETRGEREERSWRARLNFGLGDLPWNEELVLQRYELLFEAGLVPEAVRRGTGAATSAEPVPGEAMLHDHRRILATAIARLRAKIKYRPVVFELMPPRFTLLQLQRMVEALAGQPLHKQNFRRLIDSQALVEETGEVQTETGGRPAKLFRYRPQVLRERAVSGTKLPLARGARPAGPAPTRGA